MTPITAKRHENAAYWFADTDRELRRVVWLDPAYGGNAGCAERGIAVLWYSSRAHSGIRGQPGARCTELGHTADYETAERLAHEALTALAAERDEASQRAAGKAHNP